MSYHRSILLYRYIGLDVGTYNQSNEYVMCVICMINGQLTNGSSQTYINTT